MSRSTATYETIKLDQDVNMRYSCCTDHNFFVPMHWHDSIEVIYVLEGESIINMEQRTYTLSADNLSLSIPISFILHRPVTDAISC